MSSGPFPPPRTSFAPSPHNRYQQPLPRAAHPRNRKQPHRRTFATRLLIAAFVVLCGITLCLAAGSAAAYAYLTHDLPSTVELAAPPEFQTTRIYDRNGVLLAEAYDPDRGRRTDVPLAKIPKSVVNAFLAAEDARFYANSGIDLKAIVRAFLDDVHGDGVHLSGGSTITQQLIKNSLLSNERSLTRKVREAILAVNTSRSYSKDQILSMYLNSIYLGSQAYGVEAASEVYFGKPVTDLDQAEAAVLAGLPRSPSDTNPFADEEAAKNEQLRVLRAMVYHNMMTQGEADAAAAEPLAYARAEPAEVKAPQFVTWVKEQLAANAHFGSRDVYQRGLSVTTTLDYRMQQMAELIVADHVNGLGGYNVHDGALVAINPATGEVLAMVGSADYNNKAIHGEVNVVLAPRQPGSSIKPITYLAAFLKGWSPGTIIEDAQTTFPTYPPFTPRNYDGQFHGKVTARTALANSYNIPAVKTLQFVGVPAMIDLAKRMGITTFQDPNKYGLALTLGGGEVRLLELTSAYGVLAQGGQRVPPVSILQVTDSHGTVLEKYTPRVQQVVDPAHAYLVTSILSDNDARAPGFGANSPLKLSRPAAVKTGTTDDFKDNWTIGYTSQIVVGVWVGNADGQPMRGTTGLTGAAPIWHDFMEYALQPLPVDQLPAPSGLRRMAVTRDSGKLWTEGCPEPKVEDYFVSGTVPQQKCATPTPLPTATPELSGLSPWATLTPRPTWTPGPTIEELRARVVATATAEAQAFATRYTEQQAALAAISASRTNYGATATAQTAARQAQGAQVAGAQATALPAVAATATSPPAVRSPAPTHLATR